jgi:hypothetical protein
MDKHTKKLGDLQIFLPHNGDHPDHVTAHMIQNLSKEVELCKQGIYARNRDPVNIDNSIIEARIDILRSNIKHLSDRQFTNDEFYCRILSAIVTICGASLLLNIFVVLYIIFNEMPT